MQAPKSPEKGPDKAQTRVQKRVQDNEPNSNRIPCFSNLLRVDFRVYITTDFLDFYTVKNRYKSVRCSHTNE